VIVSVPVNDFFAGGPRTSTSTCAQVERLAHPAQMNNRYRLRMVGLPWLPSANDASRRVLFWPRGHPYPKIALMFCARVPCIREPFQDLNEVDRKAGGWYLSL
jgi:hypothetical protein